MNIRDFKMNMPIYMAMAHTTYHYFIHQIISGHEQFCGDCCLSFSLCLFLFDL